MDQIDSTNKKYIKIQKISQGSYGVVYKARNTQTQQIVAIKKFKKITNQGIPVSCIRQLHILNTLKQCQSDQYQKTLKLLEIYHHKDQIQMVIQWFDQTLSEYIKKDQYNPQKLFKDILISTLELHENFIIHRDIKSPNIMINNATGMVKIIDYGMAKEIDFDNKPLTNQVGSLFYRAPQLLFGTRNYDFTVDIWALGCVFYQILTKKIIFKGQNQLNQINKIFQVLGTPKQQCSIFKIYQQKIGTQQIVQNWKKIEQQIINKSAVKLLKEMLSLDPIKRPSISKILKNQYFLQDS